MLNPPGLSGEPEFDQNDHKIKSGSPLTHVRERNKKYDGCYLRHYAQGFFCFFFILVFFAFAVSLL